MAPAWCEALRQRYPDAIIEALGGPRMAEAGATIRYPMEGLAAFGLVEVVTKLGAHCPPAPRAAGTTSGRAATTSSS